jgi:hypothetical protein
MNSLLGNKIISVAIRAIATLLMLMLMSTGTTVAQANTPNVTVIGPTKQSVTAVLSGPVTANSFVRLSGRGFNTAYGIYVTYCVLVKPGVKPSACGPFDITGVNNASVWISSHPPLYAALLVKPFGVNGSFSELIKVTRMIGAFDCKKVKCALYTRADHTFPNYRKADVAIPVTLR